MTDRANMTLGGQDYVVLSRNEYDRLSGLAKAAELPPLPRPDADGNYPAAEYVRASMARTLVSERARLGLSQKELANLAGVRVETICRLETGKHTVSTITANKIGRALKRATSAGPVRSSRARKAKQRRSRS